MSSLNRLSSILRRNSTAVSNGPDNNTTAGDKDQSLIKELRGQIKRGLPVSLDPSTVSSIVDAIRHKDSIDDRKYFLEHALTTTARLEPGPVATFVQNKIVERLYNDLAHPPATSIGNAYAWRTADGSANNPDLPNMGKAGTPYARSVQQLHPLPKNQLPDAGLIFDTLLKREGFVKHPAGLSSLMFSFAALVIHTVFRTSHHDVNINETSSYVDLSPLYGHNQEVQNKVRVRDGSGRLYPDVFAEDRLLLLPPAVCVLLVLFNRNHNYIADKILEINERGTYVNPTTFKTDNPADKKKLIAQEEELFQIARLVNCGWFASVVFSDYFSCILGLIRDGSSWSLDPFSEIRNESHSVFERGKGNVCSVEFNCLYRWHATTSVEDEKWVGEIFNRIFDGKPPEEVTPSDFKAAGRKLHASEPDIKEWTFGRIQRQADGAFKDDDLANILQNATEHPAAAFRARGTPAVMRLHEIMGIEQNRQWGVCSLNDFRRYLGLRQYKTFKEWNPDPEIADAAEKLYGHIDNLELYVGLQAEEAKPVMEGAGLCPGFTISRAILSDAIALTRGDRFFTQDYTSYNLTAWGFADCQRDPNAFGFGSTLGRLFLRTLPKNYSENNVYAFFPLMTPDAMKTNLTKLKVLDQYDLSRPTPRSAVKNITGYHQIAQILKNDDNVFVTPHAARAARVIRGKGFYTVDGPLTQQKVHKALAQSINGIPAYFYETTRELVSSSAYSLVGKKTYGVDVVRDVLKLVPVYWAASELAGIQLKTKSNPYGDYTPTELFDMLGDIYSFVFLDVEPSKVMVLEARVSAHVNTILGHINGFLRGLGNRRASVSRTVGFVFSNTKKTEQSELVKRLAIISGSSDELANMVLALMVGFTAELSLALTNTVNFYLGSEQEATIRGLATNTKGSLDGYIYEALRLDPPFQGAYRTAVRPVKDLGIKVDDRVFLDVARANTDEYVFSFPGTVDASRESKAYLYGSFSQLGEGLAVKIIAAVIRAIYSYENVRRAPGQSGVLPRFKDHAHPDLRFAYLDVHQFSSAWPTSLSILYDVSS